MCQIWIEEIRHSENIQREMLESMTDGKHKKSSSWDPMVVVLDFDRSDSVPTAGWEGNEVVEHCSCVAKLKVILGMEQVVSVHNVMDSMACSHDIVGGELLRKCTLISCQGGAGARHER